MKSIRGQQGWQGLVLSRETCVSDKHTCVCADHSEKVKTIIDHSQKWETTDLVQAPYFLSQDI